MTLYNIKIADWTRYFSYEELTSIKPTVQNDKLCQICKYNKCFIFDLKCCKDKSLCGNCLDKLYDNDVVCPFCKNILDV